MKILFAGAFFYCMVCNTIAAQPVKTESIPRQPFLKYTSVTGGDTATFYLSETHRTDSLPLVVFIQGSGSASLFGRNNGVIVPQSGFMTLFDIARDRYRVLVVEKPGVSYLQNDADNPRFHRLFSLQSWADRIRYSIAQVVRTEKIDRRRILVAGHSEGGLVAATVATTSGNTVSHTAILAGEGVSQLYSLYRFAEEGVFFQKDGYTRQQRIDSLQRVWNRILQYPNATDKFFWGFTNLRWSSFLKTSVLDQLAVYDGRTLILQGSADNNVYPESATVLYTALLSKGKNVQLTIVEGADHSFNKENRPAENGWQTTIEKLVEWFLN